MVRGDIYENTPAQGIVLDDPGVFGKKDFEFSTSRPSVFKKANSFKQHHSFGRTVTFNGSANTLQTYTDAFSMKWNNVGTDQSGDRIDVKIVCSKLEIKYEYKGQGSYPQYPTVTSIIGQSGNYLNIAPQWYWYMKAEFTFYAYKTGTAAPANGMFLTEVKDLDCAEIWVKNGTSYISDYNSSWAESIQLVSGYGNKTYITKNNFLNITDNGTWFRPTKGDNDTYDSGVIFSLSPNGGKMKWNGNNTSATLLFYSFSPHYITASRNEGGTITKEGKNIVGWKNTPTYIATALKYHRIKSVAVNGETVTIPPDSKTFSYIFAPVTSDCTINVQFEPIPIMLTYNKNTPNEADTRTENFNAGSSTSVKDSMFDRPGYSFTEWNTSPDGTGTAYLPSSSLKFEEDDVILYAQWKPVTSITYDKNLETATGEMPEQTVSVNANVAAEPVGFSSDTHKFVGWNDAPNGTGIWYLPGDNVPIGTEPVVLYAIWKAKPVIEISVEGHGIVDVSLLEPDKEGTWNLINHIENDSKSEHIVEEGSSISLSCVPSEMWYVYTIEIDGENVPREQLSEGTAALDGINKDHSIRITFSPMVKMPETGESGLVRIWSVAIALASLGFIGIGLRVRRSAVHDSQR